MSCESVLADGANDIATFCHRQHVSAVRQDGFLCFCFPTGLLLTRLNGHYDSDSGAPCKNTLSGFPNCEASCQGGTA